jgi:NADPH-dependent 2,4-dienoyl-CoA reductase/sulfur reductase-like enzyme
MDENKYDIVIVGGGASGVPAALRARRLYKDKSVLLITKEHKAAIPCAIPYVPYSIENCDRALLPYDALIRLGVNIVVDEVVDVDRKDKRVVVASGKIYGYDKLILAVGGRPSVPPIDCVNLKNVVVVYKGYEKVVELQRSLRDASKIVIIGGGFVGVELADDIANLRKDVTIVEMLPHCLLLNFDEEFAVKAEEQLKQKGVKIITGRTVKRIYGKERAESVELDNGESLPVDLVVIASGYRPDVELAKKIGLNIGSHGIIVDEYMRTSDPDIFAIGDCAEKRHFLLEEPVPFLLASIACQEANIAVMNLYGARTVKRMKGWCGTFVTKVGDLVLGCTGVTESFAKRKNLVYVVGKSKVVNRHPSWFPGGCEIELKLIFLKDGTLVGAQGSSTCHEVAEIINALSIAVQNKMKVDEVIAMEFASHPKLTASPGANPIVMAALDAFTKL